MTAATSFKGNQPTQTSQVASIDFFVEATATSDAKSVEISIPKNEGWATFDTPQFTSSNAHVETHPAVPLSAESLQDRFDPFSTVNGNMQWPSFEISNVGLSFVTSNVWQDGVWNAVKQVPVAATDTQSWNAFEDSTHFHVDGSSQGLNLHYFSSEISGLSASSKGPNKDGIQSVAPVGGFSNHVIPSHGDIQPNGISRKSTNPFDFPFDSDVEPSNLFLDMGSLQAALPDALLPATFGGIPEPWLPQNTATPYISSAGEGGLSFMAVQTPSSIMTSAKKSVTFCTSVKVERTYINLE
ncbi:probable ADP-ribosylation factor GTPase-activating protein AGD14 [Lathyrus oleraceus]|nr:probable ADP-ribosylation factor GTPase-activating protein AGD14 [Pisum sativum]